MINCPRCGTDLVSGELLGQPTSTCPRCGGMRLTGESLGSIVADWQAPDTPEGNPVPEAGVQISLDEVREHLHCPACQQVMETFNYGGDSGIILSRCAPCGALWLDRGEFTLVARWAAASRQGIDWDRKRFSGELHREEVRQDALEQQDIRTSPYPPGTAAASPLVGGTDQ